MEYVQLPGCGLRISRMCLGTMTFGEQVDETAGLRAVELALDRGVNFFDTANVYCNGHSERILGKALLGRRNRFLIATKAGLQKRDDAFGLSRKALLDELDGSLRRLQTDHVDIYYLHAPDYQTPVEETLETLDIMVRSGKVRYIGTSNHAAWQICRLHHLAAHAGLVRPTVTQAVYNLVTRGIEGELLPFLKEYGQGLVAYNPLAGGLLTEKYADKRRDGSTRLATNQNYADRYWNEENLAAWDDIKAIADDAGLGMVELATRWLLDAGKVDCIITGFSAVDQLERNLAAMNIPALTQETLAACDRVWEQLSGSRFRYNR